MSRPRGRPNRDAGSPSRADMLTAALDLLGTGGADGFTMRALAARLQVNPMTIYHRFGDRDGLIAAMADRAYSTVPDPTEGSPRERIQALLHAYHAQVLRHADLTLLIFAHPAAFPQQARRITDAIGRELTNTGLSADRTRLWVNILIDFTHGAALATAISRKNSVADHDDDFDQALAELLNGLRI